jgi:hypothetical protein
METFTVRGTAAAQAPGWRSERTGSAMERVLVAEVSIDSAGGVPAGSFVTMSAPNRATLSEWRLFAPE